MTGNAGWEDTCAIGRTGCICLRLFLAVRFSVVEARRSLYGQRIFVETYLRSFSSAATLIPNARQYAYARELRLCAGELLHYYYEKETRTARTRVRTRLGNNVERPSDWMDSAHLSSILHYFFLSLVFFVRTLHSVAVLPSRYVSPHNATFTVRIDTFNAKQAALKNHT